MRRLVILDADDTLWFVEELYDAARQEARRVVERYGFDGELWEELERAIDVNNAKLFGLSTVRFPRSCVEAYVAVAHQAGVDEDLGISTLVRQAAESVFRRQARPAPGVNDAIAMLKQTADIALLTKGDYKVQMRRLDESGLSSQFGIISVVNNKTIDSFRSLLQTACSEPQNAWSVGNSLGSDILPALELEMRAVWVDADVWEFERAMNDPPRSPNLYRAKTLLEAVGIIANASTHGTAVDGLTKSLP